MATKRTTTRPSTTDQSELIQTLEQQIEGLQSDVHALINSMSDKAESKLDRATDAVAQTSKKGVEFASDEVEQVRAYIKKEPLKSVGLALGAGIAIALLSRG